MRLDDAKQAAYLLRNRVKRARLEALLSSETVAKIREAAKMQAADTGHYILGRAPWARNLVEKGWWINDLIDNAPGDAIPAPGSANWSSDVCQTLHSELYVEVIQELAAGLKLPV